ncbi:hypothetical protein SLE2022_144210 [Rubroshorea leprosula]
MSRKDQIELSSALVVGVRDSREKRRKDLKFCYPQERGDISEESTQQGTSRISLRAHHQLQQVVTMAAKRTGSSSLSDGCIAHRNQVLLREMNLEEVRRIINVGKRLGIQMQENEEEVQSRLMEMEARDVGQGKE